VRRAPAALILLAALLVTLPTSAAASTRVYLPIGGAAAIGAPVPTTTPSATPQPTATNSPTPAATAMPSPPTATATPALGWQRSDVVFVFLQGFSSDITPTDWDHGLWQVRDALAARGWSRSQFFSYGYRGGSVANGVWTVNTYSCGDTLQSLATDAYWLDDFLYQYGLAHPATRFVLVGHSLGGSVVWRHFLNEFEGRSGQSNVVGAVTIDSPLQGISSGKATLGDLGCVLPHQNQAQAFTAVMNDLSAIYASAPTSQPYWASIASRLRAGGVPLTNFGNDADCLYYPFGGNCPPPSSLNFLLSDNPANWSNDRFTQWLDGFGRHAFIPHQPGASWLDNHSGWLSEPYVGDVASAVDQAAEPR
jgi:pimeloyl-ACP methyl ester carboxylesterase